MNLQTELASLLPVVDALPAPTDEGRGGIVITGATGLVGASLLASLLETTDAPVTCLVRGETSEPERTLRQLQRWADRWRPRLVVLKARLDAPRFGLDESTHRELVESTSQIYHSAARVHWTDPYDALRPHNIDPTLEVLRFATTARRKAVHYVSTLAVTLGADRSRPLAEDEPAANMARLDVGYLQSKWVAEQLLLRASGKIDVTLYRAPYVLGDEESGVWLRSTHNFLFNLLDTCIRARATPEPVFDRLPMISASELARAVLEIGRTGSAGVHHVFRWVDAGDWIESLATVAGACAVMPMEAWLRAAAGAGPTARALAGFVAAGSKPSERFPRGPFGHYMWTEWPPISDDRARQTLRAPWSFREALARFFPPST